MAQIEYKLRVVDKTMLRKLRKFIKPYDTKDLTIVLTDDWTKTEFGQKVSAGRRFWGFFHSFRSGETGWMKGAYGFKKKLGVPLIAVKLPAEHWWWTFCHEFGHYIDYKTNTKFRRLKAHGKEDRADVFADLATGMSRTDVSKLRAEASGDKMSENR